MLHLFIENILDLVYLNSKAVSVRKICRKCRRVLRNCCKRMVRWCDGDTGNSQEMAGLINEDATHLTTVEEDALAHPAYAGPLSDYNELMLQYGFVVLFAPAFPLGAMMAWCNNLLRVRMDGYKICTLHRRPLYSCAEDIGSWMQVLQALSAMAILSNSVIIAYSCPSLSDHKVFRIFGETHDEKLLARLVICLVCEHFMLFIRFLIAEGIPNLTDHVKDERKRRAWEKACEEARHLKSFHDKNLEYVERKRMNEAPDRYEHHVDDI